MFPSRRKCDGKTHPWLKELVFVEYTRFGIVSPPKAVEFVQQRRGIGSALLAQLLTRQPHDRALLSTQTGSRKARSFYAKNGWSELASVDFGPGYPPYLVLGKRV